MYSVFENDLSSGFVALFCTSRSTKKVVTELILILKFNDKFFCCIVLYSSRGSRVTKETWVAKPTILLKKKC